MKSDPEDIHALAEDLRGCIQRHPDAIRNNPDIAGDLVRLRDKTEARYRQVTETPKLPEPPPTGFVQ